MRYRASLRATRDLMRALRPDEPIRAALYFPMLEGVARSGRLMGRSRYQWLSSSQPGWGGASTFSMRCCSTMSRRTASLCCWVSRSDRPRRAQRCLTGREYSRQCLLVGWAIGGVVFGLVCDRLGTRAHHDAHDVSVRVRNGGVRIRTESVGSSWCFASSRAWASAANGLPARRWSPKSCRNGAEWRRARCSTRHRRRPATRDVRSPMDLRCMVRRFARNARGVSSFFAASCPLSSLSSFACFCMSLNDGRRSAHRPHR